MFETIQLLSLGAAAVVDTALLLALLEQRNRRVVRLPLLLLLAGVWLWHAGLLALALSLPVPGDVGRAVQWLCQLAACAGLLLMPCAMAHALLRLWRTGLARRVRPDPRHALAYLPLLALAPLAGVLDLPPRGNLLAPLLPLAAPYLAWVGLVDLAAGLTFLRLSPRLEFPPARRFFAGLGWLFLARTALHLLVFLGSRDAWPAGESYALLACVLAPVAPVLLLAYYVVRHDFLQLVMDRTVVHAGLGAAVLLFHQVVFQDVSAGLPESYRAPLVFLEGTALAALVLLYPPLRQRSAEALRYLAGAWVAGQRGRLRRLATELSARAGRPPAELLNWFGAALREALEVDFVAGWLFHSDGVPRRYFGAADRLDDGAAALLYREMGAAGLVVCNRKDAPTPQAGECLQAAGAALAVLKASKAVTGLLLIGRHGRNRALADEEVSAVHLLVEQLAITLENGLLQADRLAAERRAAQGEKLSALGLLAGSIAHEVKNPLSAIKAIATVLAEDLGPDSPHAEDLRLILGEVDRLGATTAQLLQLARPRPTPDRPAGVAAVLTGTLRVLRHLARQQDVALELDLADDLPAVRADELALHEIFFNLLTNALAAAGPGGRVTVTCAADDAGVVAEVRDDGPGLPAEVRARLFEPFLTTREGGTGLGLYVVGRRVRELGGAIACASEPGRGTAFTVRLPRALEAEKP